jgi:hypothetical protein
LEHDFSDNIKKQSANSLIIIWVSGAIAFLLLSFSFFSHPANEEKLNQKNKLNSAPGNLQQDPIASDSNTRNQNPIIATSNEAYVFVNINRKYFLTKFVAYVPDQILNEEDSVGSSQNYHNNNIRSSAVERKLKYSPRKEKTIDFEIKKVPE